ncbi:sugar-binding transcriptional regulator [bacterium]|nr:MAG: sugar-binding transcriptional regulator [bacterium]
MAESDNRLELLARVASLYYDQKKRQDEIADEIGMTRSAVSRLLTKAEKIGIVEHIVHYPWRTSSDLEQALQVTFHLKGVSVLQRQEKSYNEMLNGMGVLAAQYFTSLLPDIHSVGVSWGSGLYHLVQAFRPQSRPDMEVVQLMGGTGGERGSSIGPLLAPSLANHLGCTCCFLHAPLIMKNETARDAILEDQTIRQTLEKAEHCDVALVGIGSISPELYNPYRLGYLSAEELEDMHASGIVGDVAGIHYDINGNYLGDHWINHCWIGISEETLRKIPLVMGVAGDAQKAEAIYGALRAGYIDVLITDDLAARRVLELHRQFNARKNAGK